VAKFNSLKFWQKAVLILTAFSIVAGGMWTVMGVRINPVEAALRAQCELSKVREKSTKYWMEKVDDRFDRVERKIDKLLERN